MKENTDGAIASLLFAPLEVDAIQEARLEPHGEKHMKYVTSMAVCIVLLMGGQLEAQNRQSAAQKPGNSEELVSGIAWFGVLKDGLKEAKRTGKPILFLTAAPQCNGVPGMW